MSIWGHLLWNRQFVKVAKPMFRLDIITMRKRVELGQEVSLNRKQTREEFETNFPIDLSNGQFFDRHEWTSPVKDFILTAKLPVGYEIYVNVQSGDSGKEVSIPCLENSPDLFGSKLKRTFFYRNILFAHQAVKWKIVERKVSKQASI